MTGAAEASIASDVQLIARKWREVGRLPNIDVSSALDWTMSIAPRDPDGESWTTSYEDLLNDKLLLRQKLTEEEFRTWYKGGSTQWRRKQQTLGTDWLQLKSLLDWLYPGEHDTHFWKWQPAMFVRDLTVEGRRAITSGMVGSGKTNWSIWCAEQLFELIEGKKRFGPQSVFSQIRPFTSRERYKAEPEELKESRLDPGNPMESLGLFNARRLGVASNFSIRDRMRGAPSPIKDVWDVSPLFSGILRIIGKNLREGAFNHAIIDEAGNTIDKNLQTSNQMKTWRDFFRVSRKLNVSVHLLTQRDETDFPDDMLSDSTCFTTLIPRDDNKGPKEGFFTVPGFLNRARLTDIPLAVTDYATSKTPGVIVDVRMGDIVNYMARRETDYEVREKKEWGIAERVDALEEAIGKFALSESEMDEISRRKMRGIAATG
jgi:hypothetical protein